MSLYDVLLAKKLASNNCLNRISHYDRLFAKSLSGGESYEGFELAIGETTQNTTTGKNLLDKSKSDVGHFITTLGYLGTDKEGMVSDYIEITPNTDYYISGRTAWNSIALFDSSKTFVERINMSSPNVLLNVSNTNVKYIRINASAVDNDTLMLEEGSTATSYEEYTNGASPNPDYPQPIISRNGNVTARVNVASNTTLNKDFILPLDTDYNGIETYIDTIKYDGGWKKEKKIGKVTLNGSESIEQDLTKTITQVFTILNVLSLGVQDGLGICNYFINQAGDTEKFAYIVNAVDYENLYIAINKTRASTVQEFKTWLSTHNTVVYYPLETPTTTEITDTTLITSLNKIAKYCKKLDGQGITYTIEFL